MLPKAVSAIVTHSSFLQHCKSFDSFSSSNDLPLLSVDVKRRIGRYTQFELQLSDDPKNQLIDRDMMDNCIGAIIPADKPLSQQNSIKKKNLH